MLHTRRISSWTTLKTKSYFCKPAIKADSSSPTTRISGHCSALANEKAIVERYETGQT